MIKRISSLIPKSWISGIRYLLTPAKKPNIPPERKAYIFLAADYGNLGDIALTFAQKQLLLKHFPNHYPVEVPSSISLSELKGYIQSVSKDDIVTIIAGGNMGDVWSWFERYRQLIVSKLRKNSIYQFPQTTTYTNTTLGRNLLACAKYIYYGSSIKLMAREKMSYDFMQSNFDCSSYLAPDIVMTFKYWKKRERNGILLCLRDDREQSLNNEEQSEIKRIITDINMDVSVIDTKIDDTFKYDIRYVQLEQFINRVSSAKVIVTDRLHGMIFAYITGTPAIVLPNSNRKIEMCYEWISNCGFIRFFPSFSVTAFSDALNAALTDKVDVDKDILDSNYSRFQTIFNTIFKNE